MNSQSLYLTKFLPASLKLFSSKYRILQLLFQMADPDFIQFKDKSISQLVQELNSLGDDHVAMQPTKLIAIQDTDSQTIRRFRSRSLHKTKNVSTGAGQQVTQSEFFLADGSQKKYYYSQISNELETTTIATILHKFEQGFNTSIVMQFSPARYHELISKIQPWFEDEFSSNTFLSYFLEYRVREAFDLLSGSTPKAIPLSDALRSSHPFYEVTSKDLLRISTMQSNCIKILKMMKKDSPAQLRIVLLPEAMINSQVDEPSLKIVRSQLTQILNYIKTYPNKKYENINKLLPKRYPTTTAIAEILLYDSANFVINWATDNLNNKSLVNGRFDLYDRFFGVSNLIKKVPPTKPTIIKKYKSIPNRKQVLDRSPQSIKQHSPIKGNRSMADQDKRTKTRLYAPHDSRSTNQLEYCRTFERKTHRYSIDEFGQEKQQPLFPEKTELPLNQNEAIAVLKAQHAREISQYHETIQNLNQKLLILSSQKGLSEIFTIHEREIMLLQLKIEQLRKDISKICSKTTGTKEVQNLKAVVKKLNDELAGQQKASPAHKLAQGKIKMLEKDISQFKTKYQKSEEARKHLTQELEALTKRLQLKDHQCGSLKQKEVQKYTIQDLAAKQEATYREVQQILQTNAKKEAKQHVLRKLKNILGDLSEVRETVLECNNFLVDLQDHIESRLSEKDPDVVLDCNRFIRSYLLQNLNIF